MKMKFEIKHRYTAEVLFSIETESMKLAVEAAVKSFANLHSADLSFANLHSANLRSADLHSANLHSANLRSADLHSANLHSADLRSADLHSADLSFANLHSANLRSADLHSADLHSANLHSANLHSANLSFANLKDVKDLILPTGETWQQYLTETVPALLTAGGKALESFADSWKCHEWTNCPMAYAFDVHDLKDIPVLLRPRADQFIQFYDAGQIPWPLPTKESY